MISPTITLGSAMSAQQVDDFYAALYTHITQPETELIYHSPFELLVAVLLSAQATDVSVNKATVGLFAAANTPQLMLNLGLEGIKTHIASIGLYHTKAKHLMATCEQLLRLHDGQVPNERTALEALPGVGRKTANVLLNTLFGEPVIAVDTHIFRLGNRTGLAIGSTPLAVEQALYRNTPAQYLKDAHHLLILHGRYTCTARKPKCATCCAQAACQYPDKQLS
jgi:endonuclease-3